MREFLSGISINELEEIYKDIIKLVDSNSSKKIKDLLKLMTGFNNMLLFQLWIYVS